MVDLLRVPDSVAGFWVDHQLELLTRFLELVDELNRVLQVNVVVHGAMDDHQFAVEIGGGTSRRRQKADRRAAFAAQLRKSEEAPAEPAPEADTATATAEAEAPEPEAEAAADTEEQEKTD